MFKLITMVTV